MPLEDARADRDAAAGEDHDAELALELLGLYIAYWVVSSVVCGGAPVDD